MGFERRDANDSGWFPRNDFWLLQVTNGLSSPKRSFFVESCQVGDKIECKQNFRNLRPNWCKQIPVTQQRLMIKRLKKGADSPVPKRFAGVCQWHRPLTTHAGPVLRYFSFGAPRLVEKGIPKKSPQFRLRIYNKLPRCKYTPGKGGLDHGWYVPFFPRSPKRRAFLMQVMIPQGQRLGVLGERWSRHLSNLHHPKKGHGSWNWNFQGYGWFGDPPWCLGRSPKIDVLLPVDFSKVEF